MRNNLETIAFRTSLVYWIAAVLWILLSDRVLAIMTPNLEVFAHVQTYKGWAFVTVTAILLYFMLRRQLRRWDEEAAERRRIEEALMESEGRYRSLFENSTDGILLTVLDGQVLAANPEACRIFGLSEEEMLSVGREGVIDPDDVRLEPALEERRLTGRFKGELTLVRRDGSKFPAEVSSAVLKDRNGKETTSMIIRDITERKRAEEMLMQKEEYLRALVENNSDAIAVLDADLKNVYRSPSRKRILGYDSGEPEEAFETVHPDDLSVVRDSLNNLMSEPGSSVTVEARLRHKDGTWRTVEATAVNLLDNPAVRGVVVNYRDITERKRSEEAMHLWVTALQSAANSIVITDRDGDIVFVNAAFTQLTGYSPEEAIGKNPRILKSGRSPLSFYKELWNTITAGSVWHGQLVNKRKNGTLYDEEMTITPVRDEKREVSHFIAIKSDISERKRLQEQLIQSQKMESIGVLAAGIAHDFNNVLGIILGHATLMEHIGSENEKIRKGVDAISKAAERGASLVRQMLTFARKGDVSFSLVSLNDSVKELQKLFYETFPRTITLVCNLEDELPLVKADSTQVHQVLLNLSVNARDAMEGSGVLIISTQVSRGEDVKKRFPSASSPEYAVVTVSDTGYGMDEETRRHIFEPFFTTKGVGKGTGLGLSVVFGIMENHRGFVDVESEPGKGASFVLYFPASRVSAAGTEDEEAGGSYSTGGAETILVVEDEEMLRELASSILTSKGYNVITASDGDEAVETYEHRWKEIDLVLSDFGLPKRAGDEVLKRMKTINPEVKFIIATGFVDIDERSELLGSEAKEIIMKPYKPAEILAKVRAVLDL